MLLLNCCSQYARKFGKLSRGHRTGKSKLSFQSQRKAVPKNVQTIVQFPHFTQRSKYRLTPSQPHTKAFLASVLFTCQIIPGFQPKNQKVCQQLCIFSNRKNRGNRNQFIVSFFFPCEFLKYKCEYLKHENLIKVCCMFHFFCLSYLMRARGEIRNRKSAIWSQGIIVSDSQSYCLQN